LEVFSVKLTHTAVKNAKPRPKSYKLSDGEGLYLLVKPTGGKYWRFKYMYLGKEKLLAFGTFPETSLDEAREKRMAARKLVAGGGDPGAQKKQEKRRKAYEAGNSFQVVAKEWFETNKPKWSPRYAARLWQRLYANTHSELGNRPIGEIGALDLLDVIRKIEGRKATDLSHRVLQICGAIFRFAVLTGRIKYNPVQDLQGALVPHKGKNHPTILAKQLPDFFKHLETVKTSPLNKLAIRFLLLTFVRTGELRQARWQDIDAKAKEWRVPAHIMKMRQEHIVPLANQTIALLEELKRLTGTGELLFPAQQRRRHKIMSENTINHVLKDMGYHRKLVGHGFRALASTTLNENGFAPDVIERQLAHAERNKVRAAYNRAQYLPERRKMMQWWADYLDQVAAKN
jgi:integrase